jgi:hypothetical protein
VRILVAGAVVVMVLFGVGCGTAEQGIKDKETAEQSTEEETTKETTAPRETTESTTPFEFEVGRTPMDEEEGDSPEDVLALQYEYINRGDYDRAYSLFARQSRREVSLEQYRAFFEANAPYSVTNYSFSPAQVQGDSASVDATFTITSASGVERLERTQEFVREGEDWRVVMRPEQIAAFTATDDKGDGSSTRKPVASTRDLDCSDFGYQEYAQAVYEQDTSDPNGLDGPIGEGYTGEQGEACEELPHRVSAQPPAQKSQSPRPRSVVPTPTSAPTPPPRPAAPATPKGDVDCSDFSSSAEAQGYLLPGDPYRLDADHDGQACDSLN